MSNITKIAFKGKTEITIAPMYQYDYGQIIKFVDLNLPSSYEVHFSNYERGTSTTNIGDSNGVSIPDIYLQSGLPVYVWIYLHTGLDDGETEYKIIIPINKRAQPSNAVPSQAQIDVITQTIAALNSAVTQVSTLASAAAQDAQDAIAARQGTQTFTGIVQGYKEQIETAVGSGYITLGSTRLTEVQLQALLSLIED